MEPSDIECPRNPSYEPSPTSEVGSPRAQQQGSEQPPQTNEDLLRKMFELQNNSMLSLIEAIKLPASTNSNNIKLPEFDPEKPDADARAWCNTVNLCFGEYPLQGGPLIIALSGALKGSASQWLSHVSFPGMQWSQFRELFTARYDTVEISAATLINLHGSKPRENECLSVYAARLMTTLTSKWQNMSKEDIVVSTVLAHLTQFDKRLQRLAFTTEITSRDKLQRELQATTFMKRKAPHTVDETRTDLKRVKTGPPARCFQCGKVGHRAQDCRSKDRRPIGMTSSSVTSNQQSRVVCFRCGGIGIFSSKCTYKPGASSGGRTMTPGTSAAGPSTAAERECQVNVCTVSSPRGQLTNNSCTCIQFTSTYNKERGTFTSPDYPRPYPPRIDCLLYTFLAAPHEIVELIFTDFDIYKDPFDCIRGDYLKVYWEVQGPGPPGSINERSAWARTLCGNRAEVPTALYSPGPALMLEFHTGPKHYNATGFVGTYSFIDKRLFDTDGVRVAGTECDFQFSRSGNRPTHGRFYSPQYPSIYPNNVRCSYHFQARPNERVKVIFEEVSLQKGDISCLRRADIIKVFDGRDTSSPVIAMLCNELTGYEVLSTGPALLLQFTANSAAPGQGFAATFTFQPAPDSTAADSDRLLKLSFGKAFESLGPEVSATTSSCHQEFSSDVTKYGTLSSPHYPSPYPPNTHCHYEFFGRGKERVRLIFQDFYLYKSPDGGSDCTNVDSLQAFVNVDGRLEKVETYCGINLPKPIMSNGPKLMLEFRGTQSSRFSRGFKLSYAFVENFGISSGRQLKEFPCAFVYNSSESRNGTFASPNSPGPYPRDTECSYFFYGGETEKVHLHFTNFDVEGVLPCEAVSASDYVEFSNYMTEDNRYGRYCGQMKEFHVESERNFFKVTFRSNDRLDGSGFKAVYQFLEASDEYRAPPVEDGANSLNTSGCTLALITFATILLHHYLYC